MKLAILDPGHFHAALVQKNMYAGVDEAVHVYAPAGPELDDYLRQIGSYNARAQDPTRWRVVTHTGADFLERFVADRSADVVVIAGNNRRKAEYLTRAVTAGFHTLADKPMAIDLDGFEALGRAFALASERGVLLYDIMTERHEITTMLQKEFSTVAGVFGELLRGAEDDPAVTKESVHHFSKQVSGVPIVRPAWFFDTAQQGEGLVDITTHLVDLVQWECFPGQVLDYRTDIRIASARRWPTVITPAQFAAVTKLDVYPDFLRKDVQADGTLHTYANGEIVYSIKGVYAKVSVRWNFEAPAGAGDTHFSVMRGTRRIWRSGRGRPKATSRCSTSSPRRTPTPRPSPARWSRHCRGCGRRTRGSGSSGPAPGGRSPCRTRITSATRRISARSPGSSWTTSRAGRCRAGRSRTCWPSTTRRRRRSRWRSGPEPRARAARHSATPALPAASGPE